MTQILSSRYGAKPCFIDGRCSYKTYLVVAAKPEQEADQFNAIGVRDLGDQYRVHAYPSFGFFGLETPAGKYDRPGHGYEGCYFQKGEEFDTFLAQLTGKRGVVVAPMPEVPVVSARGFNADQDAAM